VKVTVVEMNSLLKLEALKKGAIFIGALVIACLILTALTYSLAGHWFTLRWWAHVAFVVVSFTVCIRTGFSDTTNALQQSTEVAVARILARFVISPRVIALLYLLPSTVGQIAATTIVGFGFYRSAVYYSDGLWLHADCAIFVMWLLWSMVMLSTSAFDKTRLVAERALDGHDVGFRWPRLGRVLQRGGDILALPTAALICFVFIFVIYAVIFTVSLAVRYYAAVACVSAFSFSAIMLVAYDAGIRLQTAPVQLAADVTWEVPTGLLLRSFVDDNSGLGSSNTLRMSIEGALTCGEFGLGLPSLPRRWLTLVRPGQRFVAGGVQRVAIADEEWKAWVSHAISRAAVIVVMLGNTRGLEWELRECAKVSDLCKLRVIILPQDDIGTRQHILTLFQSIWGDGIQIPQLPRMNTQVVSFWWEGGVLKEEKLIYRSLRGAALHFALGLSSR
jgi:hypothetical protein